MPMGVGYGTVKRAARQIARGVQLLRVTVRKRLQNRRNGRLHGSIRRSARGGYRVRRR